MAITYNAPPGTPSGIDGAGSSQMNVFFWQRKALIEAAKEMYFTPLADVTAMPKNYGKTIKCYHYMPLLDDRNINDQGIDAAGATILSTQYKIVIDKLTQSNAVQANADAAVAAINAVDAGVAVKSGAGPWIVTLSRTILNATGTLAQANAILAQYPLASIKQLSGNLYGSSKDIGTIGGKLPTLGENGGRVNRVGFTRILREGTITKFGFFTEWTQDAMDFDSDDELYAHLSRELVIGATQLTEAVLQKDLIAGAGVVVYAGAATTNGTITGEAGNPSIVDYADLMRLARILTDNRTPKQTKIITGSRMIDTMTISAGRVLYIGSELESVVKGMTDLFAAPAFIPVSKYGDAGTILNGEIGTVDQFRIVVVPEMLSWTGVGATVVSNPGYMESGGKYNVYPMLVVGDGAFTTIGFQTGGKMMKFIITTKMPGKETADRNDPYGETGFSSIKWFYGTMMLRPERLALIKTIAKI